MLDDQTHESQDSGGWDTQIKRRGEMVMGRTRMEWRWWRTSSKRTEVLEHRVVEAEERRVEVVNEDEVLFGCWCLTINFIFFTRVKRNGIGFGSYDPTRTRFVFWGESTRKWPATQFFWSEPNPNSGHLRARFKIDTSWHKVFIAWNGC